MVKIPFTNLEFNFRKANPNTVEIDKNVLSQFIDTDKKFQGARAMLDPREVAGDDQVVIPMQPLPMQVLYETARYSDVLRTVHQSLRKEIFRLGYSVKEVFANKCNQCGKEFDNITEECDECHSTDMSEPDVEQKKTLIKFCKSCNDNHQDIIKVSEEINDDEEIIDDGYMLFVKDYYWGRDGMLIHSVPVELLRVDPKYIRLIADRKGRPGMNMNGQRLFVCLAHRNSVHMDIEKCPNCGRQMFPAYFRAEEPNGNFIYYAKEEICHKSKYNSSLTYGCSLIYSVWMKVVTLMNMDMYMKNYYTKQRPPRGLLFVNTPNMDSLTKAWGWMMEEFKKNPHTIPPIAVEQTAGSRGNLVNFIDFMRSMDEMQFIECRNEFRRQIGACYSVMPLFQADISTSGGLNNEGLQITVTNRAVKDGQGIYNDEFYPWVCKQLGVTDYKIELNPNEEQDLVAKEDLRAKRIQNARMMQEMGFEVTLNEDEEFEYDPIDEPVEAPEPFAGMSGAFPGASQGQTKPTGTPGTGATGTGKPPDMTAKGLNKTKIKKIKKLAKGTYRLD